MPKPETANSTPNKVHKPLPTGVYSKAMQQFKVLQAERVAAMYNRHRALFAEFLVAQLLPGAEVIKDPGAAWDVLWTDGRRKIRVQVKCSGEYLPHNPTKPAVEKWDVSAPKSGWDPDTDRKIGPGHHCDVFVLARHTGTDITSGWEFAALPTRALKGRKMLSKNGLSKLGYDLANPSQLAPAVRRAATDATR